MCLRARTACARACTCVHACARVCVYAVSDFLCATFCVLHFFAFLQSKFTIRFECHSSPQKPEEVFRNFSAIKSSVLRRIPVKEHNDLL